MTLTKVSYSMINGAEVNVRDFGAVGDGIADDTIAIQAAIDSGNTGLLAASGITVYFPAGRYKITGTLLLKRSGVCLLGDGFNASRIVYSNVAGGIAVSGDVSKTNSLLVYQYCSIKGISFGNGQNNLTAAANDPDIYLDITSFSYSEFDVDVQTVRPNGVCIYAQGNSGASPYYNKITGWFFGGDPGGANYTQTGIKFAQGTWTGGSNGPNANVITNIPRAASLDILVDLQAGQGNMFSNISGESINTAYWRLNFNPAVDSGTSSGSNTQNNFFDTFKSWIANQYTNGAIKITGGTGAGQVRSIAANTSTRITVRDAWAVIPDNTSTYEIYERKGHGNSWVGGRAEGLASNNPDYIQAYPGTDENRVFAIKTVSLGSGVFVRDESGSARNSWYGNGKVTFTESVVNPGPSANINIYPKTSVLGGVSVAGDYALEWVAVKSTTNSLGDSATITLDVGGISVGGGDPSLQAILSDGNNAATVFPGPTGRQTNSGLNDGVFVNVQTGASFSSTADLQITWCISLV